MISLVQPEPEELKTYFKENVEKIYSDRRI
jgi:hypothetical protein